MASPIYDAFRPITTAWAQKLEAGRVARAPWKKMAMQCRMFVKNSYRAMQDESLQQFFWGMGPAVPKFKVPINLAFEFMAITLPELMWAVPHRDVAPKLPGEDLGPNVFGGEEDPMWQMHLHEMEQIRAQTEGITTLMGDWLNYTPREQWGGGLRMHSQLATIDALLTGRGVQVVRPYMMGSSGKRLTGCFHEFPERLITDPDYPSIHQAKWVALFHYDDTVDVERRFNKKPGTLFGKGTTETAWSRSEVMTSPTASQTFSDGKAKNKIGWWEIWSKGGVGCRFTAMDDKIKSYLEEILGDNVYLAIAPGIQCPLQIDEDELTGENGREQIGVDELRERFAWPIPLHEDHRFPVTCLDFYHNTDCTDPSAAWPIPPLEPAMAEMQALNYLIPWALNAVYDRSRSFWMGPEEDRKAIEKALKQPDGGFIGVSPTSRGPMKDAIDKLEQAQLSGDVWKAIEMLMNLFRMRVGLLPERYGVSETQSRTAQDAKQKSSALNLRTEFMREVVVDYQQELAVTEAIVTHLYIRPEDVVGRYGQTGAMAWQKHISEQSIEQVVRQMNYTVSASSIRRPNRERDIENLQEIMQFWLSVQNNYASESGDYQPINGTVSLWGKLHDMEVDSMLIPPPQPPDPQQQQLQMEAAMLANEKVKAEIGKLTTDAQATMVDAQVTAGSAGTEQAKVQQELQFQAVEQQVNMAMDSQKHQQDIEQDAQIHILDLVQGRQSFDQQYQQAEAMGKLKLKLAAQQAAAKLKTTFKKQGD